ncbi:MAG: hypothetical protein E7012_03830 [Alphaproteobacteria bacterium]|nr:hypothetical protein [Alphaproteobacteria bacterium]
MQNIIILCLVVIIFTLLAIVFKQYLEIKYYQEKLIKPKDLTELNRAVARLISVRDKLKIVEQLQYESYCKEELVSLIKDFFFFGNFTNSAEVFDYINRQEKECSLKIADDEAQAMARVYQEILKNTKRYVERDKLQS